MFYRMCRLDDDFCSVLMGMIRKLAFFVCVVGKIFSLNFARSQEEKILSLRNVFNDLQIRPFKMSKNKFVPFNCKV